MNTHCKFTKSLPPVRQYCMSGLSRLRVYPKIQHSRILICDQLKAVSARDFWSARDFKLRLTLIVIRASETPTLLSLSESKDNLSAIRHVEFIIGNSPLLKDLILMICDTCLRKRLAPSGLWNLYILRHDKLSPLYSPVLLPTHMSFGY